MLCAAAGGYLLQDVRNHGQSHDVETHDGKTLRVNSLHHQMMAGLEEVDHKLLAWASPTRSGGEYIWKNDLVWQPSENWKEPEFVYFPKIKGYAIQWHPEMMREDVPATVYIMEVLNESLF